MKNTGSFGQFLIDFVVFLFGLFQHFIEKVSIHVLDRSVSGDFKGNALLSDGLPGEHVEGSIHREPQISAEFLEIGLVISIHPNRYVHACNKYACLFVSAIIVISNRNNGKNVCYVCAKNKFKFAFCITG